MIRKILVVDDSVVNRQILGRILRDDYTVVEAENGVQALQCLRREDPPFSAVVLDLVMPVMDGYETLRQIRADSDLSSMPVIVASGITDSEAEVKALSLGANDFLVKPYNATVIKHRISNTIKLTETSAHLYSIQRDKLTGLYNREAFFAKAGEMIAAHALGTYVLSCFDVDSFKVINDQYGPDKGDQVLTFIAEIFRAGFSDMGGICGRIMADNFAVLYPLRYMESPELARLRMRLSGLDGSIPSISYAVGRYIVDDPTLSVSAMYDRAAIAKLTIKGRYDSNTALYDESMREDILREQDIVGYMNQALAEGQFEAWLQPQYNHATGALIGAEALVRWKHPTKGLIPPGDFVPVFERNGFIYEMDKHIWEQACVYLRKWLDAGESPLPLSVNVSRYDIFQADFFDTLTGLVERYEIPIRLLRLEVTESAFAKSAEQIIQIVRRLNDYGFTIEIDDFGSGYSSLNTLKDVPAEILKLDMRFLENNENSRRGGNILESIVRMAKWLGMPVIAEGVETAAQADYLKSIGCYLVQGFLYARPMPVGEYEALFHKSRREEKLTTLQTVDNLDNNAFWDPNSLETLIFNSYVGGACIFEYHNGEIELLRVNDKYAAELGGGDMTVEEALSMDLKAHMDEKSRGLLQNNIKRAVATNSESACEICLADLPARKGRVYMLAAMRMIARAGERCLIYCQITNITAQREAERQIVEADEQLRFLNQTAHDLLTQTDTDKGIEEVLTRVLGYFQADRSYVIELDGVRRVSNNTYEVCAPGISSEMANLQGIPMETTPFWWSAFRNGGYINIEDVNTLGAGRGEERRLLMEQGIRSLTAVPMRRDGRIVGFIGLDNPRGQQSHVGHLQAIGDYLAAMLAHRDLDAKIASDTKAFMELMNDTPGGFVRLRAGENGVQVPVYVNAGFCKIVDMTQEEVLEKYGRDALWGVHPEDVGIVKDAIKDMYATGQTRGAQYRLRHGKDGYTWVMIFGRMVTDETGGEFFNIYYTDLSEQDRKRLSFREMIPAALAAVMESAAELSFVKDRQSRYVCCSQAFARISGLSSEKDIVDKTDFDLVDQALAERFRADDIRILTTDEPLVDYVYPLPGPDGATHYYSASKYPLKDSYGNIIGLYGNGWDVTGARETDSRLKLLTDSLPCGLASYEITPERVRIRYFSDGFYNLTGYTKEEYEALADKDPFCLMFKEDLPAIRETVAKVVQGKDVFGYEYRIHHKDGDLRWVDLRGVVSERKENAVLVNTVKFDVTEQKTAAEALRVRGEEYAQAIEHSGKLIYRYAHAGKAVELSEAAARLFGTPRRLENIPESVIRDEAIAPESVEEYLAFYSALRRGDPTGSMTVRRRICTGEYRWFNARFSNIFGSDHRPVSAIVMLEDVTDNREMQIDQAMDRKRMLLALRTVYPVVVSVNMTKATYQIISGGEYLGVDNGVKGAFMELIALGAARMPEEYACGFTKTFDPEALLACFDSGVDSVRMEYRERAPDGRLRWVETLALRVDNEYDGDMTGVFLCRNIDQQKAAEDRLQAALEQTSGELSKERVYQQALDVSIPVGTVIYDQRDGSLIHTGGTLIGELGYTQEEFLQFHNNKFKGFVLEEDYGTAFKPPVIHTNQMVPAVEQEFRVYRKDGAVAWLYQKRSSVQLENRQAYIVVMMDITSRKQMEERLRLSEEEMKLAMSQMGKTLCTYDVGTHLLTMPEPYRAKHGFSGNTMRLPEHAADSAYLDEQGRDCLTGFYGAILRGDRTGSTECRIKCEDGSWRWESLAFVSIFDSDGKPGKAIITVEDATLMHEHADESAQHRENEQVLQLVAEHSDRAIYRYDVAAKTIYADVGAARQPGTIALHGDDPEEVVARGIVLPESVEDYRRMFREIHEGRANGGTKLRMLDGNGASRWVDVKYSLIKSDDQQPRIAVLSLLDITENHEKELAYDRYLQSIDQIAAAEGTLIYLEADVTADVAEKHGGAIIPPDFPAEGSSRDATVEYIARNYVVHEERDRCREFFSREHLVTAFADGARSLYGDWPVTLPTGAPGYFRSELQLVQDPYTGHIKVYTLLKDVTQEKLAALDIQRKVEMDGMTGLYNKTTCEARIQERLSKPEYLPCALLLVDLDNLKMINDTLGHNQGDRAIRMIGDALRSQFRQSDIVGRVGGDEFEVFLENCGDEAWLSGVMNGFMERLFTLRIGQEGELPMRGSVGIAYGVTGRSSYDELFKCADRALYHVKRNGKSDFAFYTPDMEEAFYAYRGHTLTDAKKGPLVITMREADNLIGELRQVFDIVRLVDAERMVQYQPDGLDNLNPGEHPCYMVWSRDRRCDNCISIRALRDKCRLTKYECVNGKIYHIIAVYVAIDGKPYVLEAVSDVTGQAALSAEELEDTCKIIDKWNRRIGAASNLQEDTHPDGK